MRRLILSENEIRRLIKKTLLREQGEDKTIAELQSLLASKGFTEVGTADGKAGPKTLSAINRALGLNTGSSNAQTNTSNQSMIKNPTTPTTSTRMLGAGHLGTTDYKPPQERLSLRNVNPQANPPANPPAIPQDKSQDKSQDVKTNTGKTVNDIKT